MNDTTNVPIWIGTNLKLVSGINTKTTCQSVIESLVQTDNPKKFVLVEKWKQMERRLDGNVRILKVWKAWGNQKDDVALILKHHHSTDGYIDKRMSNKVLRRNKSSSQHKPTNHEEKLAEMEVDRLLKLVLTQGETIQVQLKKLRQQEQQIEQYEEEMHKIRSLNEGDNYLVESYLRDGKGKKLRKERRDKSPRKSGGWLLKHHHNHHHHHQHQQQHQHSRSSSKRDPSDSKGTDEISEEQNTVQTNTNTSIINTGAEGASVSGLNTGEEEEENLQERNELMERICDLNSKLTKEEENLVKLGLKIKKYYERHKRKQQRQKHEQQQQQQQSQHAMSHHPNDNDDHEDGGEAIEYEENQVYEQGGHGCNFKENNPDDAADDEELGKEPSAVHMDKLLDQLVRLRDVTNDQLCEIELNEKSLNELEEMLDSKHDHVAHLTYQIQLLDQESENLRNRLFKFSQTSLSSPQSHHHHHHHPLHPLHPHQFESGFNLVPLTCSSSTSSSTTCPHPSMTLSPISQIPGPAPAPTPVQSSSKGAKAEMINAENNNSLSMMIPHQGQIITPHPHNNNNNHLPVSLTVSADSSSTSVSNPSTIPFQTQSSSSENVHVVEGMYPNTQINLHIKPCRDNQDIDSNSDTGISSLHSSGDENTLFVLDTLV